MRRVDYLLTSLGAPNTEMDPLWTNEAERRIDAYQRGEMKALKIEEVLQPKNSNWNLLRKSKALNLSEQDFTHYQVFSPKRQAKRLPNHVPLAVAQSCDTFGLPVYVSRERPHER